MRAVLVIALKDLRQRLRDRSAVVVGLVAPLVVAFLMSVAFSGADSFHFTLALADADHGPVATAVEQALAAPEIRSIVHLRTVRDAAAAASAVRGRTAEAALVLPAGLSASVAGQAPRSMEVLTSVNHTIEASVTQAIATSFVAQLNADRLSLATAVAAGAPAADTGRLQAAVASLRLPIAAVERPAGAKQLKVISYYSPGMAIFFVLFLVSYTARGYFTERDEGMIERMRAGPVRPIEILAGKSLSVFVFGLVDLLVIAGVTTAAFGASWGPWPAVVLVCAALVLSVVALTALVMVLARSVRQAEGIASAVVFGLALLGGNFVFVSALPDVMRRIALLTPNGWALRAFTDLSTIGGGLRTTLVPVGAILAFTAVVGAVVAVAAPRAARA